MKHVGECMPDLKVYTNLNKNYDEEKCRVCGAIIRFYRNEYKKACNGNVVHGYFTGTRAKKRAPIGKTTCYICLDKGYRGDIRSRRMNTYTAIQPRCNCPKGMKMARISIPLLIECEYSPRTKIYRKEEPGCLLTPFLLREKSEIINTFTKP